MAFCANIVNYSELMSTIVFHRKWNRTRSASLAEQKLLDNFENDENSITNAVWMLTNGKYIVSLAVLMALLLRLRMCCGTKRNDLLVFKKKIIKFSWI